MATHVAEATPHAMWDESCEARHAAGTAYAQGDPIAALELDHQADVLLADARLLAVSLGLNALVRQLTRRRKPQHAIYPIAYGSLHVPRTTNA